LGGSSARTTSSIHSSGISKANYSTLMLAVKIYISIRREWYSLALVKCRY
jgi:hypothetical protein